MWFGYGWNSNKNSDHREISKEKGKSELGLFVKNYDK